MGKRGRLPRKGRAKRGSGIRPPRVHFGLTNLKVTGFGGAPLLAVRTSHFYTSVEIICKLL